MTDRKAPEDDRAWLLARERGEPLPVVSEASARRYAQLGALIAALPAAPAGTEDRPGWEQDVLAAIDAEASRSTVMARRRRRVATLAACAAAAVAIVAIAIIVRRDRPRDDAPRVRPGGVADSFDFEKPVLRGQLRPPDRLDVYYALQGLGAVEGHLGPLHEGAAVRTERLMHVEVATSTDATLYLALCSHGRLRIFPSPQGVPARRGELTRVPGDSELLVDHRPGSESLYLIASRDKLALADPALAALITTAGRGPVPVDCARVDLQIAHASVVLPDATVLRGEAGSAHPLEIATADTAGIVAVRFRYRRVAAPDDGGAAPR